jgi:chromosome segregation ATPase
VGGQAICRSAAEERASTAELQARSLGEQLSTARDRLHQLACDVEGIQAEKREAEKVVEELRREVAALRLEAKESAQLLAAAQLEAAGGPFLAMGSFTLPPAYFLPK